MDAAELQQELDIANGLIETYELEIARLKDQLAEARAALVKAVNAAQPQTVNNNYYTSPPLVSSDRNYNRVYSNLPDLSDRPDESTHYFLTYNDRPVKLFTGMEMWYGALAGMFPSFHLTPGDYVTFVGGYKPASGDKPAYPENTIFKVLPDLNLAPVVAARPEVRYYKGRPVKEFKTWADFNNNLDGWFENDLFSVGETGKVYQVQSSGHYGEVINIAIKQPLMYSDLESHDSIK